jgi:hypothetical protein
MPSIGPQELARAWHVRISPYIRGDDCGYDRGVSILPTQLIDQHRALLLTRARGSRAALPALLSSAEWRGYGLGARLAPDQPVEGSASDGHWRDPRAKESPGGRPEPPFTVLVSRRPVRVDWVGPQESGSHTSRHSHIVLIILDGPSLMCAVKPARLPRGGGERG